MTVIPGVVFSGDIGGILRAYDAKTGRIIWDTDTKQEFKTEAPGTYRSRKKRLGNVISDAGRSILTDAHYRALRDAVAAGGHRALPQEQ